MSDPWMFAPLMVLATFVIGSFVQVDYMATILYNTQPDPSTTQEGLYRNLPISHFRNSQWFLLTVGLALIGLPIALMATQYASLNPPFYRDTNWLVETSILLVAWITFYVYNCYLFYWMGKDAESVDSTVYAIDPRRFESASSKKEYGEGQSDGRRTMNLLHRFVWSAYVIFGVIWLYTPGNAIGSGSFLPAAADMNNCMAFMATGGVVFALFLCLSMIANTRRAKYNNISGKLNSYGIKIESNVDYGAYTDAQKRTAESNGYGNYVRFAVTGNINHQLGDPLTPVLAHAQAIIENDPEFAKSKKISATDFRIRGLVDATGKESLYIVSSNTAATLDKNCEESIGSLYLEHNNTPFKGDVRVVQPNAKGISAVMALLPYNANETAVYMKYPYDFGFNVMHYDVGWYGVGFGYWLYVPFALIVLFVSWGLLHDILLLRDAMHGLIMWSGTFLLAFVVSLGGHIGQFWHLFVIYRLVFLAIMYENPNVVGNDNSYITDTDFWRTNTSIYFPNSTYTTIDNSTTVYAIGAVQVSWAIYVAILCTAKLIVTKQKFASGEIREEQVREKIFPRDKTVQGEMKTSRRRATAIPDQR